jgi:hypothetical protein
MLPSRSWSSRHHALLSGLLKPRNTDLCPAGFPDPFAVVTINGEQTKTTQVSKRTLHPYWNEAFDLSVVPAQ